MTSALANLFRLLARMGFIFMLVALVGVAMLAASIYLPPGRTADIVGDLVDGLVGLIPGQNQAYAMFEPDEMVYDNALGADVPRIYYLYVPRLGLYAPVVAVSERELTFAGVQVRQPHVPHAYAVGWSQSSAPVGETGNTVFLGHNNIYGEVFKDLWHLQSGDQIVVQTASGDRIFRVSQIATFEEQDRSAQERLTNAAWIAPTPNEQLTLVTCWPYFSNTHRLVVVALPEQG